MTIIENLSRKYGKVSFDNRIGNVKKRLQTGHPDKRYFTLAADTGDKVYWVNLIEARYAIKQDPEAYREVTTEDVDAEVATRDSRNKRAEVIENTDEHIVVKYMGKEFICVRRDVLDEAA